MAIQKIIREHDNCLMFVFRVLRYARITDYLLIRKSKYAWFPHFAAMCELDDGDTLCRMEYIPNDPRSRWLPPFLFKGNVKTTYYKRVSK
jgi:hypothetical protein